MEAHYCFGESAPIGRPSGHFAPRTTRRPKHGCRHHLDYSIPCRRILVPSMIMLLWLVSRAVLHTANLCDKLVSTSIQPIACDIQDRPHCETIYPCGLCDRKVDWGVKGIACDSCNMWYHCSCISMQSTEYGRLDSTSAEWRCFGCDFSFPDNSLEVSNSFSLLAGPMFNDVFSNTSVSSNFAPIT